MVKPVNHMIADVAKKLSSNENAKIVEESDFLNKDVTGIIVNYLKYC